MAGGSIRAGTRTSAPGRRLTSWRPTASSACWSASTASTAEQHGSRGRGGVPVVVSDRGRGLSHPGVFRLPVHAELLRGHHRGYPHPGRIRKQRPGREGHAMAPEHAPGRWRLGDPGQNAGDVPRMSCSPPAKHSNPTAAARRPTLSDSRRDPRAGTGRASAHVYRHSADTRRAAELVSSRFFHRRHVPRTGPRHRTGSSSPIPSGGPTCCLRSIPSPGSASGPTIPIAPLALSSLVPRQPGTQRPVGSPGATSPRTPTAICGSGSPYAGCY